MDPETNMLLCDFHIHTTYSDGVLPLRDVVDLFGRSGHDVIAVTDHIVNRDNGLGRIAHAIRHSLNPESWKRYFEEIRREAERAWRAYGMLVIPGAEMTRNTINRDTSVHMLALGLNDFLSADGDPIEILREIRARGAVSVACHPHEMSEFYANTFYLWNRRRVLAPLVDLWEVGCRWDLFPAVSREKLPHIANSDFHRPEHLYAWKTLLKAEKTAVAVLDALKRAAGIGVLRLTPGRAAEATA
jgi:predicted metal-dependent phosphoesterase TrpH